MLEAEEGEEVWQRPDSESGQRPRVHEVRLQGECTGWEVTGFKGHLPLTLRGSKIASQMSSFLEVSL